MQSAPLTDDVSMQMTARSEMFPVDGGRIKVGFRTEQAAECCSGAFSIRSLVLIFHGKEFVTVFAKVKCMRASEQIVVSKQTYKWPSVISQSTR